MTTSESKPIFDEYKAFCTYKQSKSKLLKDEIINHYIYIPEILSKRYINRGIEFDDIYQVACVGLILSVDRFDPSKGIKFATFATPTILGEIRRYFRDKGFFVKIPRKLYEVFYRAEKLRRNMSPDKCSPEEIARTLNTPVETIKKAYEIGDVAFIRSLEQEAYADGKTMFIDTLGRVDNDFLLIEDRDLTNYCLGKLNQKEREFFEMRFVNDNPQREIADRWKVSQMQVSRFEKKLLKKLRDLYFK